MNERTCTMKVSVKKIIQAIMVMSVMGYTTLLLRQYIENSDSLEKVAANTPIIFNNNIETILAVGRRSSQVTEPSSKVNETDGENSGVQLEEVFISVKTTKNFHRSRLDAILSTWFVLAREQTYFFTDADDEIYQQKTNGHLINSNCSSSHNRKALCCKMSVEFDTFLESNKKWFCHFDDDNYVNVPQLLNLLKKYSPTEDWYLGKPSIRAPLEILNKDNMQKISFWFATGGAGFCLSRALALKMIPLASDGKFISIGEKIRLPDDVTMGYIIEHLLKKELTVVEQFHSHLEPMKFIKPETFSKQITFSYSKYGKDSPPNTLAVDGFDTRFDPTRFLSLHCFLFPNFKRIIQLHFKIFQFLTGKCQVLL
uniref:Fringe-like glycosyltransferase domain-containing protein n=1 Tax=Strigamia maritima TaxID=126957 RepID=T1J8T0_STRMM